MLRPYKVGSTKLQIYHHFFITFDSLAGNAETKMLPLFVLVSFQFPTRSHFHIEEKDMFT